MSFVKLFLACVCVIYSAVTVAAEKLPVLKAGHPSLKEWILPPAPVPADNEGNAAQINLGKTLFFDPRLSGDGGMSCASCHNPVLGWSDGLPTGIGHKGMVLDRASPTIINSAHVKILMWDGSKKSLEDQVMGPMESHKEMNMDTDNLFNWLNTNSGYKKLFEAAYPNEGINALSVSKAIAAFERTIIMNNSPFDKWLAGDEKAMSKQQIRGFGLFLNPAKGNCAVCHSSPHFTDNGFHNIGLASYGKANPDLGRYAHKAVSNMKGAFKTPQLRGIGLSAPYFHDGSAKTLEDMMSHYIKGGEVKTNLDPNMKKLSLSKAEKSDIIAFLKALTGTTPAIVAPPLP